MKHLIYESAKGRITRFDIGFEFGLNLATTPGSVCFENELIQFILRRRRRVGVEKHPLLFVPP